MNLIKYNPFREFDSLAKRMSGLLNDFDDSIFSDGFGLKRNIFPAVDIKEDDKNYYLHAEVPGIKKEDIKITMNEDNILQIKGEKKYENKNEKDNWIRVERGFGEFSRSFALPEDVKQDNIKAKYKDGILEITLEKKEPSKPKEIEVKIN